MLAFSSSLILYRELTNESMKFVDEACDPVDALGYYSYLLIEERSPDDRFSCLPSLVDSLPASESNSIKKA